MAGLGAAAAPSAGQPMDEGRGMAPEEATDDGMGGEPATPEEQALYEQFVKMAMSVIYPEEADQVSPEVLANLKGDIDPQAMQMFAEAQPPLAQSPQDSVSATAVLLVMLVDGMGQQQGVEYPDDVVLHAGAEVIEQLVEVSEAAGIHEFADEEIEGLTFRAMDLFRIASPRVDQEALKAEFGAIVEADKSGQLGKILPGLPGGEPMPAQGAV